MKTIILLLLLSPVMFGQVETNGALKFGFEKEGIINNFKDTLRIEYRNLSENKIICDTLFLSKGMEIKYKNLYPGKYSMTINGNNIPTIKVNGILVVPGKITFVKRFDFKDFKNKKTIEYKHQKTKKVYKFCG